MKSVKNLNACCEGKVVGMPNRSERLGELF